jgi:hypothetical protein
VIIVILNLEQNFGSKELKLFNSPMKFIIIRCELLSVPLSVSIRSGVVTYVTASRTALIRGAQWKF